MGKKEPSSRALIFSCSSSEEEKEAARRKLSAKDCISGSVGAWQS